MKWLNDPAPRSGLEVQRSETLEEIRLYELRHDRAVSRCNWRAGWKLPRGPISKLEHAGDVRVSTLRQYLDALGARLELVAVFDDEDRRVPVHLGQGDTELDDVVGSFSDRPVGYEQMFPKRGERKMAATSGSKRVTSPRAALGCGQDLGQFEATPVKSQPQLGALAQTKPADHTNLELPRQPARPLANPKATPVEKSAAASALSQTPSKSRSQGSPRGSERIRRGSSTLAARA